MNIRQRIFSQMIKSERFSTEEENVICTITYKALGQELQMRYEPGHGYVMPDEVTVIEDYDDSFDHVAELFFSATLDN